MNQYTRITGSLTREPKPSSGKKTAFLTSGAGSIGSQHVEECKLIHSYLLYKAQVQVDQGPPHKTRYAEYNRRESGKDIIQLCSPLFLTSESQGLLGIHSPKI